MSEQENKSPEVSADAVAEGLAAIREYVTSRANLRKMGEKVKAHASLPILARIVAQYFRPLLAAHADATPEQLTAVVDAGKETFNGPFVSGVTPKKRGSARSILSQLQRVVCSPAATAWGAAWEQGGYGNVIPDTDGEVYSLYSGLAAVRGSSKATPQEAARKYVAGLLKRAENKDAALSAIIAALETLRSKPEPVEQVA